jgi:histone deacetylase 8
VVFGLKMQLQASMVQDLIRSYGLTSNNKMLVVQSLDATEDELKLFHSSSYIDFLKSVNDTDDFDENGEEQDEFGLGYDCPLLERTYDFVKTVAGGSLTAAKLLAKSKCEIAINWFGGWHHAQRDSAAGFCYVNDIVLAIHKLTEKFHKILYVDLDIHHGDGVQNAFEYSNKILTLSFHKLMPGFYPGTGKLEDVGSSKGKYYSINVPFLEGISNTTYLKVFSDVFPRVMEAFQPEALVVQCGADSLNGDEVGQSNLTIETIGHCIKNVLGYKKPTLFCGGGGYNFPNSARLWTYLTSVIIGQELDNDIPDTSEFFTHYQPTYELHIDKGKQKDFNTEKYVTEMRATVLAYCDFIQTDQR